MATIAPAGQPNDPQLDNVSAGTVEDIRVAGEACSFTVKQAEHRRGPFPGLARGVSFGDGQQVRTLLRIPPPVC
jgi:hypothetical protein